LKQEAWYLLDFIWTMACVPNDIPQNLQCCLKTYNHPTEILAGNTSKILKFWQNTNIFLSWSIWIRCFGMIPQINIKKISIDLFYSNVICLWPTGDCDQYACVWYVCDQCVCVICVWPICVCDLWPMWMWLPNTKDKNTVILKLTITTQNTFHDFNCNLLLCTTMAKTYVLLK